MRVAAVCLVALMMSSVAGATGPGFYRPLFFASSPTPSPTYTALPISTPTAKPCPGDINSDGSVTVDELIRVIASALEGCR